MVRTCARTCRKGRGSLAEAGLGIFPDGAAKHRQRDRSFTLRQGTRCTSSQCSTSPLAFRAAPAREPPAQRRSRCRRQWKKRWQRRWCWEPHVRHLVAVIGSSVSLSWIKTLPSCVQPLMLSAGQRRTGPLLGANDSPEKKSGLAPEKRTL